MKFSRPQVARGSNYCHKAQTGRGQVAEGKFVGAPGLPKWASGGDAKKSAKQPDSFHKASGQGGSKAKA